MNVVDRAMFTAYGWAKGIGDEEEILKNLLALDPERAKAG